MLEKKVFVGMNKDASAKDLKPEEYRHAENLVAVTDGVGLSARLENMLGMVETGMPVSGDAVCIGLWNYREGNKIYAFYSGETDSIVEYDGVRDVGVSLMANNLLDFSINAPVHDVFIIENLLYFNDGKHSIRKINIDYAKTGALNSIADERALSLIKTPPLKSIKPIRDTDTNRAALRPAIRDTPLQFASRYVYADDEISVASPISIIAPAVDWDMDDNKLNRIGLYIHIDVALAPIIRKVELLAREGNDGNFYIYDEFEPDVFTEDNADGTKSVWYELYLDRSGAVLSEQEIGTSSESVPRLSDAMELMDNRLFATSSLEEFDMFLDDWDCSIRVRIESNPENKLNGIEYLPTFYKEESEYVWGTFFMDDFGRKSAPAVRDGMSIKTGVSLVDAYVTNSGYSIRHHPAAFYAEPQPSGKPPVWATRYGFARSENRSFSGWYKAAFAMKPLYSSVYKTEEPTAEEKAQGIYLENGYYYYSLNHQITQLHQGAISSIGTVSGYKPVYFDLIIPDGVPVGIDKNSILKLGFPNYSQSGDQFAPSKKTKYTVIDIIDGRIRVQGLGWLDIEHTFYTVKEAVGKREMADDEQLGDDEMFMHFELLNPIKKVNTPLLYETGEVYDIVNAGLDGRAFQPTHSNIDGDCYYTAYNEDLLQSLVVLPEFRKENARINRNGNSMSYTALAPIVDPERTGNPIGVDEEGNVLSTNANVGKYVATAHNSQGRVTVEVPNQQELERGSQVRFSRTYIQDSLINGLSNFPEENKHAISSDRGDVVKLVATNERVLVAVHTRSITSLYINQRFINSGEGAAFLAQTDQVIGDDRKLLHNYGTTHPESVVLHDSRIYGFDSIMSEPWRRSQDGITPLALTFGMKTYFEEKGSTIRSIMTIDPTAVIKVFGGYDQWLDMYVLTFAEVTYTNLAAETIVVPAETLGFSERVKKWVSFYSFKPEYYASIMNNLVSAKNQSLWRHQESADRNLFYGEFSSSQITIVARESNDLPKTYQNIGIASTERWSMTCIMEDGKESLLDVDNFVLRDNIYYADILRDKNTPTANLDTGQTPLLHGEKMIGETMEITLTNSNAERTVIDAVYIGYSPMAGHLLSQR